MRIIGIDEVGRGCIAGPVVAAAVLLDGTSTRLLQTIYLTDSKKMTKRQRDKAYAFIIEHAVAYGIGWSDPAVVDTEGLTRAISLAMQQAIDAITPQYDQVIIDGRFNFLPKNEKVVTMVKADLSELSVSAASVMAKVARDTYMQEQALKYPEYGFERHVGYGTKIHIDALKKFGPTQIHRFSTRPIASLNNVL